MKRHLEHKFMIKDCSKSHYFLGIETTYKLWWLISLIKYVIDLLKDASLVGCKHASVPILLSHKLCKKDGTRDPSQYYKLVDDHLYVIVTWPDIFNGVGVAHGEPHAKPLGGCCQNPSLFERFSKKGALL